MHQLKTSFLPPTAALGVLGLFASACGPQEMAPLPEPGESALVERLAGPTSFALDLGASAATVVAHADESAEPAEFDLEILGGTAVARVNDAEELLVQSLSVELGDVAVPPELVPPDGLPLRDIRVSLERPGGAALDDLGDMIATVVDVDLLVEWSGEFEEGHVYPLRTMRLEDLPVAVEISRASGGALRAHLSAVRPGEFWQWGGLFELHDLTFDFDLTTEPR